MTRPADTAWTAIAVAVVGWDVLAKETLSEAVDRYLQRRPILVRASWLLLTLHLMNLLPERIDPIHQLTRLRPRHT